MEEKEQIKGYYSNKQFNNDMCAYAKKISELSKCLSRQVGAVITKDNRVIGIGYNKVPDTCKDCKTCIRKASKPGKHLDMCKALHAEEYAILDALKSYDDLDNCNIYLTTSPCYHCAKLIIQTKIKKIYAIDDYPDANAKAILQEAKIPLYFITEVIDR